MTFIRQYRQDIYRLLSLYGVFVLARVLFIVFMPHTYSRDLYSWLNVIDILKNEGNPYSTTTVLNWPPFWMQVLYGIHVISKVTSISAILLIQMVLIMGEAITILPCYILLRRFFHIQNPSGVLLFGFALNPICILLTCQHCNFDVFVGFWILLFVLALLSFYADRSPVTWLMACFILGMGILTKTVPVIVAPLLVTGIRDMKFSTILFGLLLLFMPVTIGLSVIFALGHTGVINNVLGYRSMAGWYGITGIFSFFKAESAMNRYQQISPLLFIPVLVFLTYKLYRMQSITPVRVIIISLILLAGIPTLGPGYSPPYIYWYLPLLVVFYAISSGRMRVFMGIGYIVLALTYITEYAFFPSHGSFLSSFFPSQKMTDLSNMLGSSHYQVLIRMPMFICYISLFIILVRMWLAKADETAAAQ